MFVEKLLNALFSPLYYEDDRRATQDRSDLRHEMERNKNTLSRAMKRLAESRKQSKGKSSPAVKEQLKADAEAVKLARQNLDRSLVRYTQHIVKQTSKLQRDSGSFADYTPMQLRVTPVMFLVWLTVILLLMYLLVTSLGG